jgi:hypothetical protein
VFVASTSSSTPPTAQAATLGTRRARVFVAHPIQDRTDDEMRALADAAPSTRSSPPPDRLADTRFGDPLGAGRVITVPVAGQAGVPATATAAVLTVTAVDACADGFVTLFPCVTGGPPLASTVNVLAGGVRANSAVAALSAEGTVCVYAMMRTDVVVDVMGWFGPAAPDGLRTVQPERLLDTREQLSNRLPGGTALKLQVTGPAPLAPAPATAVLVNITAVDFTGDGYVTAWPADAEGACSASERPGTSTVNVAGAAAVPAQTVVPVGGQGAICLFVFTSGHLVVDLGGWVEPGAPLAVTASPGRILDTRDGTGAPAGLVPAGGVVRLPVVGGDQGAPAGAVGVILNVTGVDAPAPGFVTVWPADVSGGCSAAAMPWTSSLNLPARSAVANLVVVGAGGGAVCLFSQSGAHLVADLVGWTV